MNYCVSQMGVFRHDLEAAWTMRIFFDRTTAIVPSLLQDQGQMTAEQICSNMFKRWTGFHLRYSSEQNHYPKKLTCSSLPQTSEQDFRKTKEVWMIIAACREDLSASETYVSLVCGWLLVEDLTGIDCGLGWMFFQRLRRSVVSHWNIICLITRHCKAKISFWHSWEGLPSK